jgi:prophage maintenance system killer protein
MIVYLSEDEIREINKVSLELTDEGEKYQVIQPDDIRFTIRFVSKNLERNIYRKALGFCICLIVLHPFKNGNHRTSLLSAERFLQKNQCQSQATDNDRIKLEKWRLQYEEDHELHREFFRITNVENETEKRTEIKKIMKSIYGTTIEKWLKKYNPNVP